MLDRGSHQDEGDKNESAHVRQHNETTYYTCTRIHTYMPYIGFIHTIMEQLIIIKTYKGLLKVQCLIIV